MPWKNGGGETREIAVAPAGTTLDSLDWRISLATVTRDGPFSAFDGVQRTLCVIQGVGLRIQVGDESSRVLTAKSAPLRFAGDVPTYASLVDGAIVDMNVMTRNGRFQHRVSRVQLRNTSSFASEADVLAVFCQSGAITFRTATGAGALGPEDCLIAERPVEACQLVPSEASEICLIEISACR